MDTNDVSPPLEKQKSWKLNFVSPSFYNCSSSAVRVIQLDRCIWKLIFFGVACPPLLFCNKYDKWKLFCIIFLDFTFLQALNSQLNLKSKRFRQLLPSRLQMIKRCTTTKTRCTLPSCSTFWIFSNSYDGITLKVEFLGTCIVEEGIFMKGVFS